MKLLQARVQIIRICEKAWGRRWELGGGEKAKKQNDSRKLGKIPWHGNVNKGLGEGGERRKGGGGSKGGGG
jgi:hypothetical protein